MSGQHAKRRDIEGLRALAVTLVLLYHAQIPWFAGGFLGVDVFFVISGFLITRSLAAEADASGTIQLGRFYARRARRLLPAAAVVLVATAAAVRLLLPVTTWRDLGGDIAAAAAYVVNWRLALRSVDYLAEDVVASPVQHFWSLAIEEQFYLVWPVLLLATAVLVRRRGWSAQRVRLVALGLVVALPSFVWSVVATSTLPARAFFDTGTRMWELAAGGLIALAPALTVRHPRVRVAIKAAALVTVVAAGVLVSGATPWPGAAALLAVGPTALLLWMGGTGDDAVERGLSVAPLQQVGAWSYSLYLWHWPPLAVLGARWGGLTVGQAVGITLLSVIPAVASYRLIEDPVRFSPRLVAVHGRSLALGAGLSVLGVLAGAAVWVAVPGGTEDGDRTTMELAGPSTAAAEDAPTPTPTTSPAAVPPDAAFTDGFGAAALPATVTDEALLDHLRTMASVTPAPFAAVDDLPRVYEDRCHVPVEVDDLRVCEYGDPDGDVHVALVGDSKAGQWGDALETVAERHGWRLTYLLKSGCELTGAVPTLGGSGDPNETCLAWNERVLDRLLADPPAVVLTSQVSSRAFAADEQDPVEAQVAGMIDVYGQLEAAGSRVVVLLDNHSPSGPVYECVAEAQELPPCSFERVPTSGGRAAQLAAVEQGGFASVDLSDHICPTHSCPPAIGGVLLYRQGSHLTKTYIDTLVPVFERRVLEVAGLS